jgi:hypothetical protein
MPETTIQTQIKAIETRWRGRLYRSRLEARWAVFMDTIGLKFVYEPEGYDLPDGTRYLPDFYLPEVRWFAEVKPFMADFGRKNKAYPFTQYTGYPALLLNGEPALTSYTGIEKFEDGVIDTIDYSLDIWTFRQAFEEGRLFSQPNYECMVLKPDDLELAFSIRYRAGVEAALSARF